MKKMISFCVLSIFLIFVPFIFANYFTINYYLENDKFIWDYDYLVIMVSEWISVFIASLVIRKKSKNVILENSEQSKKVFKISTVLFIVLGSFVLLDWYSEVFSRISHQFGVYDEWPLALAVTWEQYLDGTFFLCVLMCITICFFRKEYFVHKKNAKTK